MDDDKSRVVKRDKVLLIVEICVRFLAIGATLSASLITFTNRETVLVLGMNVHARYNYSPTFMFFAYENLMVCVFTILSLVVAFVLGNKPHFDPTCYFYMFLHDLVMTVVLMAGCAAATAVGYVGKHGNLHAGWVPVCPYLINYCNRGTIASVIAYFGFLFYLILTVVSAHKVRHHSIEL